MHGTDDARAAAAAPAPPARLPPRVVIQGVRPEVDGGRYPIKRTMGEEVAVAADVVVDGHDRIAAVLRYRAASDPEWTEVAMTPAPNDVWQGRFVVARGEPYRYTVLAWIDDFATWRLGLEKKLRAGTATPVDLRIGAALVSAAGRRASGSPAARLEQAAAELERGVRAPAGLDRELERLMSLHQERRGVAAHGRELAVTVERERARTGAWYELFPRSCHPEPARHGTFKDCEARLPYVAAMGFDVLYLPPVHPIGVTHRKGKNNAVGAAPGDTGSPWAVGGIEGGHTAIHPALGTFDDFRRLVARARDHGLEVALDLAFQCSPDHPWIGEHPEWFSRRPDGTIQYAENPPKKYEDIVPLHFDGDGWQGLWLELRRVVFHWVAEGVRIFRVDNPHTKPFAFWEWLIAETRQAHPDVVFLSEAFTRPKVMHELAKVGFSQSYTYFTWRNTKRELEEYFTGLERSGVREYYRPSLWPNTPDILPEYLQYGGRPAFQARLVLAATLGATYGIYGPAFELCEARAVAPGSEEYLDSEKYAIRHWDLERPESLRDYIGRVNRIRRENPALHSDAGLRFHDIDDDHLIAYSKSSADGSSLILTVVNLDPHNRHGGWLELPLADLGLADYGSYQAHELITDARHFWTGPRNRVEIDPISTPGHVYRLRRKVRSERDFDYFL